LVEKRQLIVPVSNKIKRAYLLAQPTVNLKISAAGDGHVIHLPETAPNAIASVVAAEIEGEPKVLESVILSPQDRAEAVELTPPDWTANLVARQWPSRSIRQNVCYAFRAGIGHRFFVFLCSIESWMKGEAS
jgi:hypothetical protein